jgi:TnpA family transposase
MIPPSSAAPGTVTASLIMRQLASYPRQNGVAAALRELGRLVLLSSEHYGPREAHTALMDLRE